MSQSWRKGYADPQGKLIEVPQVGIVLATKAAAPTNADAGYAPGCLFVNTAGSVGTLVYLNTGTLASATWTNIA